MKGELIHLGHPLFKISCQGSYLTNCAIESWPFLTFRYGDAAWARFWHLGSSQVFWPPTFFSAFPSVDRVLDLGFLSVSSPWQGQGVATKLATKAAQLARWSSSGFPWISLDMDFPFLSILILIRTKYDSRLHFHIRIYVHIRIYDVQFSSLAISRCSLRDQNCEGIVVIASTTATVKIVERLDSYLLEKHTPQLREAPPPKKKKKKWGESFPKCGWLGWLIPKH